ncbi:hypothetical protein A2U01_0103860, partial [Trifolium medium]|nr:hypothetical protein [Trifolium medium]
ASSRSTWDDFGENPALGSLAPRLALLRRFKPLVPAQPRAGHCSQVDFC